MFIIAHCFTCGEIKICKNIKKSQNIMKMIVGPDFGVLLTTYKDFYLRFTVEKMHVFAFFTEKYLRSYDCSGTNFTATVNCTNPKPEIQIETIETQIIRIQVYFVYFVEYN